MFKFSTTHVINDASGVIAVAQNKASGALVINRDNRIVASTVKSITKTIPTNGQDAQIAVNLADFMASGATIGRLFIYLRSVDNADPLFANDFVYKGKPFYLEFTKKEGAHETGDSAEVIAANALSDLKATVQGIIDSIGGSDMSKNPFFFGKQIVLASAGTGADDGKLKLTINNNNNLRFHTVKLQVLTAAESNGISTAYTGENAFIDLKVWDAGDSVDTFVKVLATGNTGYGTYNYLLHNLRLPTNSNYRYYSINKAEMPIPDVTYVQYIFKTLTERPEMQGTSVLGQYNQSQTTHIVWVKLSNVSTFEAQLVEAFKTPSLSTNKYVLSGSSTLDAAELTPSGSDKTVEVTF